MKQKLNLRDWTRDLGQKPLLEQHSKLFSLEAGARSDHSLSFFTKKLKLSSSRLP